MDSGDFSRLGSARKTMRSLDNHSDDSETSSVCSERSFDSYRRPSDVSISFACWALYINVVLWLGANKCFLLRVV